MIAKQAKKPSPKTEFKRMTEGFDFLMIRNWDEYQVLTPSGVPAHWIKSFVNADFDKPLSVFVGGVLDRLRRFRGRLGGNIPTEMQSILSGCNIVAQDRHNVVAAVVQLLSSGRLVPTNEQHAVSKKSRVKNKLESSKSTPVEHQWTTSGPASVNGRECCGVCGLPRSVFVDQPCASEGGLS